MWCMDSCCTWNKLAWSISGDEWVIPWRLVLSQTDSSWLDEIRECFIRAGQRTNIATLAHFCTAVPWNPGWQMRRNQEEPKLELRKREQHCRLWTQNFLSVGVEGNTLLGTAAPPPPKRDRAWNLHPFWLTFMISVQRSFHSTNKDGKDSAQTTKCISQEFFSKCERSKRSRNHTPHMDRGE